MEKEKEPKPQDKKKPPQQPAQVQASEKGGRGGLDPTRYGDWEINGKCVDF
jgi:hypothetical protein